MKELEERIEKLERENASLRKRLCPSDPLSVAVDYRSSDLDLGSASSCDDDLDMADDLSCPCGQA